ncbi:HAD family hydrolase [Halobacteriaceae archaeon GCM10025711]
MTDRVDTVLFDLDGTLVEYERHGREVLAAAFEDVGVEPFFDIEEYVARFESYVDDSDDVDDVRRRAFADIAAEKGREPELGRSVAGAFAAERDHTRVRLLPGAADLVESLAEDHRLGVVTNGSPAMQRQKLDGVGLTDAFETVVYAGYDTRAKPAPDPFYRALDALDSSPNRAIHVGNSLEADVAGALAADCRAGWVPALPDVTPDPEPHYSFPDLWAVDERPWL